MLPDRKIIKLSTTTKKNPNPKKSSGEQIFLQPRSIAPLLVDSEIKNCQQQTLTPKERPWERVGGGSKILQPTLLSIAAAFLSQRDKRRLQMMVRMRVPNWVRVMRVRL
jgi:hypothetical protein